MKRVGKYEILSVLGTGGMGVVYLAYDLLLGRKVALKVLNPQDPYFSTSDAQVRFLREAVITGKLSHAGIVPIHTVEYDREVGFYYTMRLLAWPNLETIMKRRREDVAFREAYPFQRMLGIYQRICAAVASAHRIGIIHQDLKPANIMVSEHDEVLVVDWGLAREYGGENEDDSLEERELQRKHHHSTRVFLSGKLVRAADIADTSLMGLGRRGPADESDPLRFDSSAVEGTPGYMSPEQISQDGPLGPPSDVYSLGVLLYEMLSSRLPVEHENAQQLVITTLLRKSVPIEKRAGAARAPRALLDIVTKALATNPKERYADAGQLSEEMKLYLEGRTAFKTLADETFGGMNLSDNWKVLLGTPRVEQHGLVLERGASVLCKRYARGDFRADLSVQAPPDCWSWMLDLIIHEVVAEKLLEERYLVRLGVTHRPLLELYRNGKLILRRFGLRLGSGSAFKVGLAMDNNHLRLWVGDRKHIDYHELFPQSGGALEVCCSDGELRFDSFALKDRGAPLRLDLMYLPDRLHREGKFEEAREHYQMLATNHPTREEGLLARYKSGLCSVELRETEEAKEEFSQLENTMCDYCAALGMARVAGAEENIDLAWSTLKEACKAETDAAVKSEIWYALVGLLDSLDVSRTSEKVERYKELLDDLKVDPDDAAHAAYDLLDAAYDAEGLTGVRTQSLQLLEQFENHPGIAVEALFNLARAGICADTLPTIRATLASLLKHRQPPERIHRFRMIQAEVLMTEDKWDQARSLLRQVISSTPQGSMDWLWAKSWRILALYLAEEPRRAHQEALQSLVDLRGSDHPRFAYLWMLNGLCLTAMDDVNGGQRAFDRASEFAGLWGDTARAFIAGMSAPEFEEHQQASNSHQFVEATYLLADAHWRSENLELAGMYYGLCLNHPCQREMFLSRIRSRLLRQDTAD